MTKPILIILTLAGFASGAEMEVTDRLAVDGASLFKSTAAFSGDVVVGTAAVIGSRLAVIGSTDTAYALAVGTSTNFSLTVSTGGRVQANELYRGTFTVMDSSMLDSSGSMKAAGIQNAAGTAGISVSAATADRSLDYMEYATDQLAQAAYVTNGTLIATGGTITDVGGDKVHTFTTSGTFTPAASMNVKVLVVAGGGGGGGGTFMSGGGGGGGVVYNSSFAVTAQGYSVTVGLGATAVNGTAVGNNGSDSVFSTITATGGGGGGNYSTAPGKNGGCGGGGAAEVYTGFGTGSQGGNGGVGAVSPGHGAGGGGGASPANGSNGVGEAGGNGGAGYSSSISGSPLNYAGGGGGASYYAAPGNGLDGGGNGGRGDAPPYDATSGTANTGGGGGGAERSGTGYGGAGGSGVVIIRYTPSYSLQSYSASTITTQGSYALKGVAGITNSFNKTLTRTVSPTINLTGRTQIKFDIRASTTGSNIRIGIHDSGGTTTEITPNIASSDTWQTITWDISAVTDTNKDAIDSIIVTIASAPAANTFYVDNMYATSVGNNDITFTAGSERMRIDSSGDIGIGTASPVAQFDVGGTGSMKIPVGTTAQRPANPAVGMMRFNSTSGKMEFYNGTKWMSLSGEPPFSATGGDKVENIGGYRIHTFTTVGTSAFVVTGSGNVEILLVAGGGGGGSDLGGGGGAGGVVYNSAFAVTSQTYTVTVGTGGAGGGIVRQSNSVGADGTNSVFSSLTAVGGGGGGAYWGGTATYETGRNGGSGGGGGAGVNTTTGIGGTGSQGSNGGQAYGGSPYWGGGGGGAGGLGGTAANTAAGSGGAGLAYSISGASIYYAGGGGGSGYGISGGGTVGGAGGNGGGGAGGYGVSAVGGTSSGSNGTSNTGGGGGGGSWTGANPTSGGNGGSGIVIVRYPLQ